MTPTRTTEINCNEGMDIVFVVDYTNSMGTIIDNIKNNVTSIANAISTASSDNYKLGLVIFDEVRYSNVVPSTPPYYNSTSYSTLPTSQKYINLNSDEKLIQYITSMEMMSQNNVVSFNQQINAINNSSFPLGNGSLYPEPSDVALNLVMNSNFAGQFREGAKKIIILITDNVPSGDNDKYQSNDISFVNALKIVAIIRGFKIILMTSYSYNVLYDLANDSGGFVVNGYSPTEIINAINDICN
jgi:hypothetical protein